MRYALSSTKLFASDATLARSLTFLQSRPPPSGNTTSVGERRRQASPRSDQGFLRAGDGIHRRQADRDHTEAGWLAQAVEQGRTAQAVRQSAPIARAPWRDRGRE